MQKADYYVQEYSYSSSSADSSQYILQIRYEAEDINHFLKKANLPYWRENRPLILIWLVAPNAQGVPEIIGSEAASRLITLIKQTARKDGLPAIFPMMDVADVSQVTPEDVSKLSLPILKEAAKRYSPDALLIGTLTSEGNVFKSQWQLILGNDQWNWTLTEGDEEALITHLFSQVSKTLAKHYAEKTVNAPQLLLRLEVSHVAERNDLGQLIQYLKQLTLVQQVQLSEISGDIAQLSVLISGTLVDFQENAAINQHLVLKSQDAGNNKLIYEWVR